VSTRIEFLVPDVGEGIGEAEIVHWLVKPGDRVKADQPIVEIETDKSVVEIPSPVTGVLTSVGGEPGDVLPIGAVLAVIEADVGQGARPGVASEPPGSPGRPGRVLASPATRRLALDLGVHLADVHGSGPGGRVSSGDVRAAADGGGRVPTTAPATVRVASRDDRVEPLRGVRRQIARTMTESWQKVPHITEFREIDATRLVVAHRMLRERLATDGVRFSFLPLFVTAVADALRRHERFNASLDLDREEIVYRGAVNIGIAAATDHGLVVPVVENADQRSLADLAVEIDRLATLAREQRLDVNDSRGGTFTISNFGSYGTWLGTPIIRPPESAIAGFGRIRDAVVAVDGQPVVRPSLPLAVSADHRLVDGDHLAAFVDDIGAVLTEPLLLLAGRT
jgi:pyruvate dehydrogenase E2 component (dihydrolipoamide acetyltransferase)